MRTLLLTLLAGATLIAADAPPREPEAQALIDVAEDGSNAAITHYDQRIADLKAEIEVLKQALEDATNGQEPVSVRIDCGSTEAWTDPEGNVWSADPTQGKGTTFSLPLLGDEPEDLEAKEIEQVYRTERYGASVVYRITVPPGLYRVSLKFREGYFTAAGRRVFSVAIGGIMEESALDVFKAAGGKDMAYVLEATAKPNADGHIVIELSRISSATDVPTISGIEITSHHDKHRHR